MSFAGDLSNSERSLVELARRDVDGFHQVLKSLHGFILGIARAVNQAGAEDSAQEAQLVLLSKFQQFRGSTDAELKGWIRVIVCNLCFARMRRKTATPPTNECEPVATTKSPSQVLRTEEENRNLVALLGTLSDDERSAVMFRHCENWSIEEIAAELDRSPSAIGGLLRRGMEKLRSRTTLSQWSQLLNLS